MQWGGVLPEQENPGIFSRVLDIACGPGGWLLELATEFSLIQAEGIMVVAWGKKALETTSTRFRDGE